MADLTDEKVVGSDGFLLSSGGLTDFNANRPSGTGVQGIQVLGVNLGGDVVGAHVGSTGADHGFVATRRSVPA